MRRLSCAAVAVVLAGAAAAGPATVAPAGAAPAGAAPATGTVRAAAAVPIACPGAPAAGVALPALAPRDPVVAELGLDQTWPLTVGRGVTVGVVDSGVSPASPKLAGAVDVGQTYRATQTARVFTHAANGQVDCEGHGTAVAGVIAGRTTAGDDRVSGVAPAARIYPVAIQGEIAEAPAPLIAAAIRDAAQHARVVNLSFAQTSDNADIRAAVQDALRRRVTVVASAANDGGVAGDAGAKWYPAAYPGVIAVTAVNSDGSAQEGASTGSWITIAAPGESLTSEPRGGQGYVTVTGTSFATAVVSGTVALMLAREPTLSPAEIKSRLERTAVSPGDGVRDNTVGYGTVDPFAAITAPLPTTGPTPGRPGAVRVPALPKAAASDTRPVVVAVGVGLLALAALVALGAVTVRVGSRRGWHAGARPASAAPERIPEPHAAELD